MVSKLDLGSKELFLQRLEAEGTIGKFIVSCGLKNGCGNRRTFYKFVEYYSLQEEVQSLKLLVHKRNLIQLHNHFNKKESSNNLIFTKDSPFKREKVKKIIISEELLEYKCVLCSNEGMWENTPLVLQLDHKNGINNDNRLENLRFLCPNCHTQTETYAGKKNGKNIKNPPVCLDCGIKINKRSTRCVLCANKYKGYTGVARHTSRPSKEKLWDEIKGTPFTTLSNKYGVSDNAIRKWCKAYNLPFTKKGIKEYKNMHS